MLWLLFGYPKHVNKLRTFLLCLLLFQPFALAYEELWDTPQGRERIFNALVELFKDNYWDEAYRDWDDWGQTYKDRALNADTRLEFDSALRRMVNALNDDHSRWVGLVSELSLEGGAELSPALGIRHNYLEGIGLVIERAYPETPAYEAGLRRGDVIVQVGDTVLSDLSSGYAVTSALAESVRLGEISLVVRHKLTSRRVTIIPAPISFAEVQDLPQADMLDESTGYLYIPSFQAEGLADKVHTLIADLQSQGARSLILDLRDNPGGRLGELGLVLGAFIEGPWVEAISRGDVVWRSSFNREKGTNILESAEGRTLARDQLDTPAIFDGPLAVIVTEQNSSAGEVAALVLKEMGRATIVGEKTLGNVEAIQIFDLPDESLVYVAVANLQGVTGEAYTTGVKPDIEITASLEDLARGFDAPVAEALKSLKALPFTPGKFF